MKKLFKKDIENILRGATLLGAGGGGSQLPALKSLEELINRVEYIEMISPEEANDSGKAIISAGMGSPEILLKEGWHGEQVYAFEKAEELLGNIDYVVAVETGGFNSYTAIQTAGLKSKKLIDGDGAGRAIPELEQTSFYKYGINAVPLILADNKGNSAILYPKDAFISEQMGRAITTVFNMTAGIATYYMNGKQLKDSIIPGTMTLNEKVGKIIKESVESKKDIIEEVLKAIDGYLLAKGKVKRKTVEVKGGFDFGRVFVDDIVVDFKNENMIAWKNNKPIAMVPDSICWITIEGTPLTNADIKEGMEVAVIGKKAHPKFRDEKVFSTFSHILESLGYKEEFKPIEDLV
ncbi:MAG: DUF917 domain-containing protein [Thermoplasmata archaeon]